jgi:hypothetical protein
VSFKIVLNKSGLKWYKIFLKVKLKEVFVKKIIMSGQDIILNCGMKTLEINNLRVLMHSANKPKSQ